MIKIRKFKKSDAKKIGQMKVKLTKKEAQKIAEKYNFGIIKSFKLIKGGLVNHNYIIKTERGSYVIRIIPNKSIKKFNHLKLQFKIFDYLKKRGFPYLVPYPLETIDLKRINNINGKRIWVYKLIEGSNCNRPNIIQIKQMAKALATYHKYIKKLKGKKEDSEKRILNGFRSMKNIQSKNNVDKLAIKYRDYFLEIYNKVKKLNYSGNKLYLHGDFDPSNVLFKYGKLKAIIDFDETSYGPRIFDIAGSIRDLCYTGGKFDIQKSRIFIKEYEKINRLSKKEKNVIIPIILYANVDFFVWTYVHMKKDIKNKEKYMKEMINITRDILERNKEKNL